MPASLFAGTYTRRASEGIYVYDLDLAKGALHLKQVIRTPNPSYLAFSRDEKYLYAVNESSDLTGDTISVFHNRNDSWEPAETCYTKGVDPCYISLHPGERHVCTANYSNGSLSVFSLDNPAQPAGPVQHLTYHGSGPHPERQERAHLHCTCFSPDGRYLFATDLGSDLVYAFRYNASLPRPLEPVYVIAAQPGSGPRHLIFNQAGTMAYLVLELTGQVAVYIHQEGSLELLQIVDMEEPDFDGAHCGADIHLSGDGRFLYTSNRGDSNALQVFEVQPEAGTLSRIQRIASGGRGPRNFTLSPCGGFLLVACQYTNDIQLLERDTASGMLRHLRQLTVIDSPVFLAIR